MNNQTPFKLTKELLKGISSGRASFNDCRDSCSSQINSLHLSNNDGILENARNYREELLPLIPDKETFLANKLLNEIELAENKLVLKSRARLLVANLTSACNLDCVMCGQHENPGRSLPDKTIEEIVSLFPYLEQVIWQGGEPLLYERTRELISAAGAYPYLSQHISTNGLLLNKEWAEFLVDNRVSAHFSVDGAEKSVLENIRRGADFTRLLSNLTYFSDYRKKKAPSLYTFINMVVMRSNYRQMPAMLDFTHKMGFNHIVFCSPIDFDDKKENIFYTKDEEALKYINGIMPELEQKAQAYGIKVSNNGIRQIPKAEYPENPPGTNKLLCHMPWVALNVLYDGTVTPYCYCSKPVGNAFDDPLGRLWNSEGMKAYRINMLARDCNETCKKVCMSGRMSEASLKFI